MGESCVHYFKCQLQRFGNYSVEFNSDKSVNNPGDTPIQNRCFENDRRFFINKRTAFDENVFGEKDHGKVRV